MTGRHRHPATRPIAAGVALVAALAVAGLLLAAPTPQPEEAPDRSRAAGLSRLSDAWPEARSGEYDSELADGAPYTPILFLDLTTSVGAAPTSDQKRERLLLVAKGREPRQLGTLPADVQPGFNGVVSDGERVVWAETVPGSQGVAKTTLRIADVSGGETRTLTKDTGDVVFFGSQHDLQIVGDRLYWASQPGAAERQKRLVTEIRSVPLSGGKVEARTLRGAYSMAGWPWLASITSDDSEPVTLRHATGGRTVTARPRAGEMLTCGARWCRVIVLGDKGRTRLDLMRPDGSARRSVTGGDATPAVVDVMLLGRFEPLTAARDGSAADQRLLLYDAKTRRTVLVADSMGTVRGRDGFLWWSVGEEEVRRWHVLDLRSL